MIGGIWGILAVALLVVLVLLVVSSRRKRRKSKADTPLDVRAPRGGVKRPSGPEVLGDLGGYTAVATFSGGRDRTYFYYIPKSAPEAPSLVIGLHGGSGNALDFGQRSGMRAMAEKYGYVVVLPMGLSQKADAGTWNAESTTARDYAEKNQIDDVGFITDILDQMKEVVPYDPARVYVTGISKGGMLAYLLACRIPDRISAIAPVASTFTSELCKADGISLLHIHGTADENVPWEGGAGKFSRIGVNWPPVERGIEAFAGIHLDDAIVQSDRITRDTVRKVYRRPDGASLEICIVEGGGHAWPGGVATMWQTNSNTYVSPYFDATDYIADFFSRH